MTMINPISRRIEEILNESTRFAIPKFQRDFKWGETEAQELLEDLNNYKGVNSENLFLGNFIFENPNDQKTYVVDGQQRITSIMLLMIACRTLSQKLGLSGLTQEIQKKITFTDSATAQSIGCRFIASESIQDIFEYMASGNWAGDFPIKINSKPVKTQINRVKPIYDFFYTQISGFSQIELSQFLRAIYDSYVIQVIVNSDEEALSIFERTNARGLELEVSDLLKNYLFSKEVPSIEEKWEEILVNSNGTLLRMLKYFYVSKKGYVSKPQLYRKLKEYARTKEIGPETLTSELLEFSRFYSLTKDPTPERTLEYFKGTGLVAISEYQDRLTSISASLLALREFGIVQFCPVAYAALELLKRIPNGYLSKNDVKTLIHLFESFEKYHFVNNVICERVGNEVEHLYADTCESMEKSENFALTIQKLISNLIEKRATWDEFKAVFTDISYSSENMGKIYYIFDRINNSGLDPAQRFAIFNPDQRLLRKNNNIEHFLPRSFINNPNIDKATKDIIDNIGNLLVIFFKTNSKLGDLTPREKVEKLRGELNNQIQNYPLVHEFLNKYGDKADDWNANQIQQRAEDLAKVSFQKIWALN
jgi:hypothetical protein